MIDPSATYEFLASDSGKHRISASFVSEYQYIRHPVADMASKSGNSWKIVARTGLSMYFGGIELGVHEDQAYD